MSHWNHRVVRREYDWGVVGGETVYEIHEAYYNDEGKCTSITVDAVDAHGYTLGELQANLARAMLALQKPVLDYETCEEIKLK